MAREQQATTREDRVISIMRHLIAILLIVGIFSLEPACCATTPMVKADQSGEIIGDLDALQAQQLIPSTVKIETSFKLDKSDPLSVTLSQALGGKEDFDSVGTGVVVAQDIKRTLVLTAYHVCHMPDKLETLLGVIRFSNQQTNILDSNGVKATATAVYKDDQSDLCALEVKGVFGKPAALAQELPPIGARVVHVGGPNSSFGKGVATIIDGRFSGRQKVSATSVKRTWFAVFGMAIHGGSSGGGIFYRGRLISIVSMMSQGTGNVTYGIELARVQAVIKIAKHLFFA